MSEWTGLLICIAYLAIGIVFNGIMTEDGDEFSVILMIFWPLMLGILIIGGIFTLLFGIGNKIKEKFNL